MSHAKCAATSKKFSQNENMGPLQENHSHNGPKKRRKFPPASPTQRTGPQASAGLSDPTDSPGRAHPIGIRRPFRPNGLARQGTPHRYPPAFPPQRTRPVGQASQTSAGHSRRNQLKSVFSGDMRPGKNTSQPSSVRPPKGAVHAEGCNPQFWEGPRARQATRHPRVTGLPNEAQPFLAPPKIQNSAFPTVLGWGSTSRMLAMPVRYITIRSKPRPKPACLQEPNRRRSRYHQ